MTEATFPRSLSAAELSVPAILGPPRHHRRLRADGPDRGADVLSLRSGLNKIAHEWLGWALLIGFAAHLAVNRRAFTVHFRRRRAVAIMAMFLTAPGLSFAPLGGDASPARAAIMALANAPLSAVAGLTGETPAALIARMAAAGYDALADRPIAQIVGADREAQMHMLNAALGAEG